MGAAGVCCVRERHVCRALPSVEPLDQNLGRKKVFDFCTCQVASTRATFQDQVGVARIQGLTQRLTRLATFAVAIEQRDREYLVSATENARNGPDAFGTTSRRTRGSRRISPPPPNNPFSTATVSSELLIAGAKRARLAAGRVSH